MEIQTVETVTSQISQRVITIEGEIVQVKERLGTVEMDVAVIKSNYARREDIAQLEVKMAQMENRLLRWFFATAITLAGLSGTLAFLAARFVPQFVH
ncbi:hypothetical protein GJ699_28750 [Duganella sp. FT80W]|uniref:DUF1640 domain-containing protein n=1 Tax=Duganella guangzhouensis TaxID=2666084 RepID=A0A6I2LB59_9BURK|nr:hypothetical protein [Duganella guangzhouensis]MRW93986.1 hypothetical protein [Duganella guangzhouensis]